ncbi:hypothetical protein GQ53DRAFT_802697 [Thozetella sp. PMI_491]|nr:hypothetical protein GQ53DRAFT_802697 [Thozetella sp. PMI_491]
MRSSQSTLVLLAAVPLALAQTPIIATRIGELVPRAPPLEVGIRHFDSPAELEKRVDLNQTFDLSFQALNKPLYSAKWSNATTGTIDVPPVAGVPLEFQGTSSFEFTLECADCRTYGTIVADINDNDGLNATLTFNNVGAYLDFGVATATEGVFSIGLGKSFGKKAADGSTVPFSANLGLSLALVFTFDGAVEVTGGFQLSIPNGSQLGFDIDLGFDAKEGIQPTAGIQTFTAANVTVALVLKADAGISTNVGLVEANVGAGAHLTLVQIKFGEVSSNDPAKCPIALFADIESNGGAYAKAEAKVLDDVDLGNENPSTTAVFATAGTTTCLTNTRPALPATTKQAQTSCAKALVTATTTTTAIYSLTSCLVKAVDCPASFTQIVIATNIETITTTTCPVNPSGGVFQTVPPVSGVLGLPPLQAITTTLTPQTFNGSKPANATLTGQFQSATVFATANASKTAGVVVVSAAAPGAEAASIASRAVMALLGVSLGFVVLL